MSFAFLNVKSSDVIINTVAKKKPTFDKLVLFL